VSTLLQPGSDAPDFTLKRDDGETFQLSKELKHGPVLAVFFKTSCPVCELAFPYFQRLADTYAGDGWTLVGVAQDSPERYARFRRYTGARFPFLIDQEQPHQWTASPLYDFDATPTAYWITPEGKIGDVVESFQKAGINRLAEAVASVAGKAAEVIAPPDDGNPAFKPG
jgi:peroxiredoxin